MRPLRGTSATAPGILPLAISWRSTWPSCPRRSVERPTCSGRAEGSGAWAPAGPVRSARVMAASSAVFRMSSPPGPGGASGEHSSTEGCAASPPCARLRHAPGGRLSGLAPRRARRLPGRRAGRGRDRASRLRGADLANRGALRGRPRLPGRHDLRRSGRRAPHRLHVADPALGGGPGAPASRPPILGRGLLRRTPDHVASVLTGFAGWRQLFDRGGKQFGDNVVRFHARARDEDLYVAYAIVPPQIDRGTPAHKHPEPFLHPGVVRETDGGIVIRGAHSIATSVTMADWLLVSY